MSSIVRVGLWQFGARVATRGVTPVAQRAPPPIPLVPYCSRMLSSPASSSTVVVSETRASDTAPQGKKTAYKLLVAHSRYLLRVSLMSHLIVDLISPLYLLILLIIERYAIRVFRRKSPRGIVWRCGRGY